MTTEKAHEKAPDAATVEKALAKQAEEADLSAREQKALEAQEEIDRQRGYRRILLHPAQGIYVWQHIATQHTTPDGEGGEALMRQVHLEYLTDQAR
jgi:hypothetical protein